MEELSIKMRELMAIVKASPGIRLSTAAFRCGITSAHAARMVKRGYLRVVFRDFKPNITASSYSRQYRNHGPGSPHVVVTEKEKSNV